jgi:putative ABC transport system permease protein
MALIGVVVGTPAAIIGTKLIQNQLYGIEVDNPGALTCGGMPLLIASVTASWIPALRASKVPPATALRAH